MKIFILAFCIFQITLAQVRIVAPPRPIGKFVAQKPANRIKYDCKAALAASHKLAEQAKFVIDKNGQLPEVEFGPAINNFYFLSGLLLELKGYPEHEQLANALEEFLNVVISVSGGLKKAEITLETIAAIVIFNLYADIMNNLNAKAIKKNFSKVTCVDIPRIELPADFKVHEISQEILTQLNDDFGKFFGAFSNIGMNRDFIVDIFNSFGQSILYYIDRFGVDTVDGLAKMIDPKVSEMIKNSVGTLKTQLVDVVTYLVHKGTPLGEVMYEIIITGAYSILVSCEQLVKAASPQLNESK